jgi:hypothetical protein
MASAVAELAMLRTVVAAKQPSHPEARSFASLLPHTWSGSDPLAEPLASQHPRRANPVPTKKRPAATMPRGAFLT